MDAPNLLNICTIAFAAVAILLSFLAITMHVITVLFPVRRGLLDPAVVAAISGVVASVVPGAHVSHIEEER